MPFHTQSSKNNVLILLICAISFPYFTGCNSKPYAEFEGRYVGPTECLEKLTSFDSTFYSLVTRDSSVQLFFNGTNAGELKDDVLSIFYHGTSEPKIGQIYDILEPKDREAKIVARLSPNRSCPPTSQSLYLTGEFIFHRFSLVPGKEIEGEIINAKIINDRTKKVELEDFHGTFSITVEEAPPFRRYN